MNPEDFDKAFADALGANIPAAETTVLAAVPDPVPAAVVTPEAVAATIPTPAETGTNAPDTELEIPAEGAAEPKTDPAPSNSQDEFLARFAEIMARANPTPQQVQQPVAPSPPQRQSFYAPEELQQLQTFFTDWPDVAKAAEIMARGMVKQAMDTVYRDVATNLAPYLQTIDALADRTQYTEIQSKVPDYDQITGKLLEWVDKQPAYLQPAYQHVIQQGTSTEVLDLIDRFKRETGTVIQPQQQPSGGGSGQATTSAKSATELSPAARQAAARLAPISTKRANANTAVPADFDSAFAQFAQSS